MDDRRFHPGQLVHHHHYGICIVVRQSLFVYQPVPDCDSYYPAAIEVFCLETQKRMCVNHSKLELLPHT